MDDVNPNERIDAVWVWDSETGEKLLVDRLTSKVIARWIHSEDEDDGN